MCFKAESGRKEGEERTSFSSIFFLADNKKHFLLASCNRDALQPRPAMDAAVIVDLTSCSALDLCGACEPAKLAFTQADGCQNDGSVEFCIPPSLENTVKAIAPSLRILAISSAP